MKNYSCASKRIEIDRTKLYEEVWREPATKLARRYGLSDVGFAKLCKRLNVPRPGRGYWEKLRHGKKVRRLSLPKLDPSIVETRSTVRVPNMCDPDTVVSKIEDTISNFTFGGVTIDHEKLHPLVEEARRSLSSSVVQSEYGFLRPKIEVPCMSIGVSSELLPRAIALADRILKTLELVGFTIKSQLDDGRPLTTAGHSGVSFRISVFEAIVPTNDKKRRPIVTAPVIDGYARTGLLGMNIDNEPYIYREFCDTPRRPVERHVKEFVRALLYETSRIYSINKVKLEQDKRIEEERRQREQQELEKEQIVQLENWANVWHKCERMRGFTTALRARAEEVHGSIALDSELGEWIEWANAYIQSFDPLNGFAK